MPDSFVVSVVSGLQTFDVYLPKFSTGIMSYIVQIISIPSIWTLHPLQFNLLSLS
jgi:hypothetical protein